MRHRKRGKTLDRKTGPRRALLRGLATSVIIYEKVKTTTAKAKVIRPIVEKLVTTAKTNDLNARRKLSAYLLHKKAVNKALEVLGPRYKERKGGYTRITRVNNRKGDNAEMSVIEFV